MLLKDKIAVITGAASPRGLGKATAKLFAEHGARVVILDLDDEKAAAAAMDLPKVTSGEHIGFACNVTSKTDCDSAVARILKEMKRIDVLVNNAGLSRGLTKLYEDNIENWEEMIDTNVKGLLYVTRAIVPGMVERNHGHVINLGSIAGHMAYANGSVYCATKAAERFISDGLRIDLNGTALRVTSIDPGMVETDFSKVRFRGNDERAAKTYQNIDPLKAEDIADAIVWAATRPTHVSIQSIVLTPTAQANPFVLTRKS